VAGGLVVVVLVKGAEGVHGVIKNDRLSALVGDVWLIVDVLRADGIAERAIALVAGHR
jgi:hypothetical protein